MEVLNQVRDFGGRVVSACDRAYAKAGVGAMVMIASAAAIAQTAGADPFDAALATATTKVGAYAAGLVTLSAVAVVFIIGMKYVKRIPRAA